MPKTTDLDAISDILGELDESRANWGEQNWPLRPTGKQPRYMLPSEHTAKIECEKARRNGRMTWAHILVEEVAESIDADTPEHAIAELTQVAAVALNMIDSVKRNGLG